MPKNAGQKIKLLMLYDILQRETDEEHPLSTEELVEKLREKGIEAAPRVLPRDISLLNEYGFEVLSYKKFLHHFLYLVLWFLDYLVHLLDMVLAFRETFLFRY